MTVGECVKYLRQEAGLLQRELAEQIGISASMLSLIEADAREPSIHRLRSISRALNVPAGVLFAVALSEESGNNTEQHRLAHQLTGRLLKATVHALRARRTASK